MADVYICDPNRILINTSIGNVQAWRASPAAVSVAASFYAGVQNAPGTASYVCQTLNLTPADARSLALALIEAADHADKMQITEAGIIAKTLGSAEAMS